MSGDDASVTSDGLDSTQSVPDRERAAKRHRPALMLVVAWDAHAPTRIGESAMVIDTRPHILGRHFADWSGPEVPLLFAPRRGRSSDAGTPLTAPTLSRRQLVVSRAEDGLAARVANAGRGEMQINGKHVEQGEIRPGDLLLLRDRLLLLCVACCDGSASRCCPIEGAQQQFVLDAYQATGAGEHTFGAADAFGIVGESVRTWELRARVVAVASSDQHVLISGESGVGKELAATAIHGLSRRRVRDLVCRSAATLPEGIVDAELFGNVRDYPNPGMPERDGLIGSAHEGTLFLDEIGELPGALQAHLLRVLDQGDYQRLGEDRARHSEVRVIAATNRGRQALKHDLAARLVVDVHIVGLSERREDIPLLIRHLLLESASAPPNSARDAFVDGEPRIDLDLVQALMRHSYTTHVRELRGILWEAMLSCNSDRLTLTPSVSERLNAPASDPAGMSKGRLATVLAQHGGNVTRAARDLQISRHALHRLIRKHGLGKNHELAKEP